MKNNSNTELFSGISKTGPTGTDIIDSKEIDKGIQQNNLSNPAADGYYKSKSFREKTVTILLWVLGIIGVPTGLILVGWYFANLREPVIRLEDAVSVLKEDVKKNGVSIEEIKKIIYSTQKNEVNQNSNSENATKQ